RRSSHGLGGSKGERTKQEYYDRIPSALACMLDGTAETDGNAGHDMPWSTERSWELDDQPPPAANDRGGGTRLRHRPFQRKGETNPVCPDGDVRPAGGQSENPQYPDFRVSRPLTTHCGHLAAAMTRVAWSSPSALGKRNAGARLRLGKHLGRVACPGSS